MTADEPARDWYLCSTLRENLLRDTRQHAIDMSSATSDPSMKARWLKDARTYERLLDEMETARRREER